MRKVRIGYFVSFILFIVLLECAIFMYLEKFAGGILRSDFAFVVFLLPMLALIPKAFLVLEFINIYREQKAVKEDKVAKAQFIEFVEVKNMLYRAYKVRFSWKNSEGKVVRTWSASNFSKEQAIYLKNLENFDVFVFEDRTAYIKLNKLNGSGEAEKKRAK